MAKPKSAAVGVNQNEWHIKSRGDRCTATDKPFADRETFFTRLVLTREGYEREDYCQEAWTDELRDGAVSFWKAVFRVPTAKSEALRKEGAEATLRRLIEEDISSHENTIYVLSVMLERKRVLVEREVRRSEGESILRVYEHKDTGEIFLIRDPGLRLSEIERVQEEVALLMGWKPPPEGSAPPDTAEVAADDVPGDAADTPVEPDAEPLESSEAPTAG
jgi:hypothetical protein